MILSRAFKTFGAIALVVSAPGLAIAGALAAGPAAPSPQTAVAARQAGYKKMGAAMKALSDALKHATPERSTMAGAARTIATVAPGQASLFPAGSGASAGVKNDALPAVWADRASFDAQMKRLVAEAGKLVTVVNGGDVAAIRAQFKATGATCQSCHRQFRADS